MSNLTRSIAALCCAAALPAFAAAEDITVVAKTTMNQGAPKTSTQYLGADRIRSSDGETDTIMEVGPGRFTVINHAKKEYYQFTRDQMLGSLQQFEQQMSGPMGAMMEKMMGGKVGEVTVQKGPARKIAGYDCATHIFSLGENMRYEMCVTQALQLSPAYYDALKGPYALLGPMARRFDKIFEEMKKVKGFPVAMTTSVNLVGLKMNVATEATEIRRGAIPASAFALPAGYKKKDTAFKG